MGREYHGPRESRCGFALVAALAFDGVADPQRTLGGIENPGTKRPRRIMPHMDRVAAVEQRAPVAGFVLIKPCDVALHRRAALRIP